MEIALEAMMAITIAAINFPIVKDAAVILSL
jgi:hypothetical protein